MALHCDVFGHLVETALQQIRVDPQFSDIKARLGSPFRTEISPSEFVNALLKEAYMTWNELQLFLELCISRRVPQERVYIEELRDRVLKARDQSEFIKGHSSIALTPFGNKSHAHSRARGEAWKRRRINSSSCLDDPSKAGKKPSPVSRGSNLDSQDRLHLFLDQEIQETRESQALDQSLFATQQHEIKDQEKDQEKDRDMIPIVLSEESIPERQESYSGRIQQQTVQQKKNLYEHEKDQDKDKSQQALSLDQKESLVYSACGLGCKCICHQLKGICTRCKTLRADAQAFLATRPNPAQKRRRLFEIKILLTRSSSSSFPSKKRKNTKRT